MSLHADNTNAILQALQCIDGIDSIDSKNEFTELPNVLDNGEIPLMAIKCSRTGSFGNGLMVATDRRVLWLRKGRSLAVEEMLYAAIASVEAKRPGGTIKLEGSDGKFEIANTTKSLTLPFADFVREKAAGGYTPPEPEPDTDVQPAVEEAFGELLPGLVEEDPRSAAISDALHAIPGIQGIGIKNEFTELLDLMEDDELPKAAMKCVAPGSFGSGLAVATDRRVLWLRKGRNLDVQYVAYSAIVEVNSKEGKIDSELTLVFLNDLGINEEFKLTNATRDLTEFFAGIVSAGINPGTAKAAAIENVLGMMDASDPKSVAIRDALRACDGIEKLAGRREFIELPSVLYDAELPKMLMACFLGRDVGVLVATNDRVIHVRFTKGGKQVSWKQLPYAQINSVDVSDPNDAIRFAGTDDDIRVTKAEPLLVPRFADFVREKVAPYIAAEAEAAEHSQSKANSIMEALRNSGADTAMFSKWEVGALPDILADGELPEKVVGGKYNGSIGILVATDRRLLFVDKGLFGSLQVEDFPYPMIQSVRSTAGAMFGSVTIRTAGGSAMIDDIVKRFASEMAAHVRYKTMGLNGTAAPTAAAGVGGSISIADELLKLAQLRDAGILTDEEFEARKTKLLD